MAKRKPTAAKPKAQPKGRPPGSKTQNLEVSEGALTHCGKCGSTERMPYTNRTEVAYGGVRDGKRYTHVITRRTRCADCGQARFDKHYEQRGKN